ncbi:MAG TPA: hypothetical protein VKE40_28385 [Gemmataceae bacterium]|nr:hypothetical protein [Gemmataceae bacterium]
MSLNRWKVLACTLTVGIGGLAVFARPPAADKPADPRAEPAALPNLTVKPASHPDGTDTPAPAKPAKSEEFDLDLPVVPPVAAKADEPGKKPAAEPVFEPITPPVVPAKAETDAPPPPIKTDDPKKADDTPEAPVLIPVKSDTKAAPTPDSDKSGPKAPVIDLGPTPPPPMKPDVPAPLPATPTPPMVTPPLVKPESPPAAAPLPPEVGATTTPASVDPPKTTAPAAGKPKTTDSVHAARLKLLLRMGDGTPRFEIRNTATTELLLKVYGQKVEMQAPPDATSALAGVTATGHVRFTAPGIEGTCDHLSILSGTGEVLLKGNIRLKSKYGKGWSEMTAEKMVYQIGTGGLTSSDARPAVRPASYIPD